MKMGKVVVKINNRYKWNWIFFVIAFLTLLLTLFYSIYALTHKPAEYTLSFIGYGGTFNRVKTGVNNWALQPYWIMHIVGIAGMCALCTLRRNEISIKVWQGISTGILLAVFGFVGAKILYIIENWNSVAKNGISLSGVSFFGTVFFMPAAIPIIKRILLIKIKDSEFMDFCTPAGVLMLACIRIGCFMNGCCRGMGTIINGKPFIYPVQLIESSFDFMMAGILLTAWIRKVFRGRLYFLFMAAYGSVRFVLELYRNTSKTDNIFMNGSERTMKTDLAGKVLSNGQIFSLLAVLVGMSVLLIMRKRREG